MSLNKSSSVDSLAIANNIAKVEGGIEKDFKGLEYGGELHMKCMSCDKPLSTIMKVSPNPLRYRTGGRNFVLVHNQRFQTDCPFCNSKSWIVKTEGQVMIGGAENSTSYIGCEMGDPNDPEGMFNKVQVK
jgi:Zn finger protein HypA/HybF involved in hydrogenase expression